MAFQNESKSQAISVFINFTQMMFAKSFIGKTLPVIFEEIKSDGMLHGWSDNYLPIKISPDKAAKEQIIQVKIIDYTFPDDE